MTNGQIKYFVKKLLKKSKTYIKCAQAAEILDKGRFEGISTGLRWAAEDIKKYLK